MLNRRTLELFLVLLTIFTAHLLGNDNVELNKKTVKSDFEVTVNFGRICDFGTISWKQKPTSSEKIAIATSSLGIPVWGGFWGAKFTSPEHVENGDDIFSPSGKQIKLDISVTGTKPLSALPLEEIAIEYRPLSEKKDGFKTVKVDIARIKPVKKTGVEIHLTDKIVTPHVKWGKPYSRGKTKVLFLTHFGMQRELLELNQRIDIEYDAPMLAKYWNMWNNLTYHRERDYQPHLQRLEKLLDEKTYDVIVAGGFNWANLPEPIREKLKNMINDGAGFVICLDPKQMGELTEFAPMSEFVAGDKKYDPHLNAPLIGEVSGKWISARKHFITTGIPFEFLPETYYFKHTKSRNKLITANGDPILALGRLGQGKIAQFSFASPDCWSGNCALTPAVDRITIDYPYWEYYLSLLAKSILWAGDKEPEIAIKELSPTGQQFDQTDKNKIVLTLQNTRAADSWAPSDPINAEIQVTIRDEFFNKETVIIQTKILQAANIQTVEIPIPDNLKDGIHFADCIIKNGEKIDNWATAYFKIARKIKIAEINFDKNIYSIDDNANITVKLTSQDKNLDAKLNIYDTYDRLVATYKQKIDGSVVAFKHHLKNVFSHYINVECELIKNGQVLDTAKNELLVAYANKWDDYEVIIWGFTGMQFVDYITSYYYEPLRDMGATSILEDFRYEYLLKEHARNNFVVAPIGMGQSMTFHANEMEKKFKESNDKNDLVRTPCMSNPKTQKPADNKLVDVAKIFGPLGPVGYCMGDENGLTYCGVPTYPSTSADICYSKSCMDKFRPWLKQKYGSLDKLNEKWGTAFTSWETVLPSPKKEMRMVKDGNYSSWADHREFMDDVWAGTYDRLDKALRAQDSTAKIGISGSGPPSAYHGYDYWKLANVFEYLNLYRWICQGEIWSSFFPDKSYTHWAGYGQSDTNVRYGNWWSIVNKHRGISYFKIAWFIYPDMTLCEHAETIKNSLKDIKEGIGKISITSEKLHDNIAILYSQSSLRAAWVTGDSKPMVRTSKFEYHVKNNEGPGVSWDELRYINDLDMYCRLLRGANLNYKFVSYEQITKGELSKYKALILPFTMSLSSQQAEAIKKFVKDGGLVIADVAPGVMDGSCKTLEKSSLSDLFGADIVGFDWSRKPQKVQMPQSSWNNMTLAPHSIEKAVGSMDVKVTTGKSFGTSIKDGDTVNTMIVNNYGKGKAVFLNFFLSHLNDLYVGYQDSQLLSSLLSAGGVTTRVKVINKTNSLHDYETAVFKNGNVQYLTVLRGIEIPIQEIGNQSIDHKTLGDVEVALQKDYYIYNVRDKKFEGFSSKVSANLLTGDAAFYALLPYEVEGIQIKTEKDTYSPGQPLNYSMEINAKNNAQVGNHVVRLEIYDPNGKFYRHYSKNILTNAGKTDGVVPLALNEKSGQWKLKAIDITTGKTTELKLKIQ